MNTSSKVIAVQRPPKTTVQVKITPTKTIQVKLRASVPANDEPISKAA